MNFVDADDAIEDAAGQSIAEIFAEHGEAHFRDREHKVIERLLSEATKPIVLALGGGAFINDDTRALVKAKTVSIWLDADIEVLMERTARKPGKRPLLDGPDPRGVLQRLARKRTPFYSQADIKIHSGEDSHDITVEAIITALKDHA